MSGIRNLKDLESRIAELEQIRKEEEVAIREEGCKLLHSLHPANLVKEALGGFTQSPELMELALVNGASLVAGLFTRKWLSKRTGTAAAKMAGTLVQLGITWAVALNAPHLKEKLQALLLKIKENGKKIDLT